MHAEDPIFASRRLLSRRHGMRLSGPFLAATLSAALGNMSIELPVDVSTASK